MKLSHNPHLRFSLQ